MAGKTALGEVPLQFTPTWVVAVVCSIIVIFSLALERLLHWLGKKLKRKEQNALYEALQKIKEELMLLGFISLLLVVFQGSLHKICVPPSYMHHMQPCKKKDDNDTAIVLGSRRRLLAGGKVSDVCVSKGQVPLLSVEAIHQLHIFIFILAVTHVLFSVITMVLGSVRIGQWQKWEKQINESQKGVTEDALSY